MKKIEQIKKEHNEEMDELKKLEDEIDKGGLVELIKRASTSIMVKNKWINLNQIHCAQHFLFINYIPNRI